MAAQGKADVIVVGSGAGGATVAGGLARAGLHVILIEAGPQRTTPVGSHVRNADPSESGTAAFAAALDKLLVFPSGSGAAIPGLSGYKVGHGVGGMLAMWTNNCPRPHHDELPPGAISDSGSSISIGPAISYRSAPRYSATACGRDACWKPRAGW